MASEAPAAAPAPAAASTDVVYRIIAASEWLAAKDAGAYVGTALDEKDGYIHCSTAKQVVGTLGRYFKGKTGLAVLVVDAGRLGDGLKWDPVAIHGGELYPHYYGGPLPLSSVVAIVDIQDTSDGGHVDPDLSGFKGGASMIAYTVYCEFDDPAVCDEWVHWLDAEGHMREVVRSGALSSTIVKLEREAGEKPKYEVRYTFPSRAMYDRYVATYAPQLRKEGLEKFAGKGLNYSRSFGTFIA